MPLPSSAFRSTEQKEGDSHFRFVAVLSLHGSNSVAAQLTVSITHHFAAMLARLVGQPLAGLK